MEITSKLPIPVYILSVPGKFRGRELLVLLKKRFSNVQIVDGINASEHADVLRAQVNQHAAKLLHGRQLKIGEIACHLGHNQIISRIANSNHQWSLVLEDDAEIVYLPDWFLEKVSIIKSPTIINLNSENFFNFTYSNLNLKGTNGESICLVKYLQPGTTTFAYLINLKAAQIAQSINSKNPVISTTDWPILWKYKVDFYQPICKMIVENGSSSLIGSSRFTKESFENSILDFRRKLARLSGYDSLQFKLLGFSFKTHYFDRVLIPILHKISEPISKLKHYER